MAWGSAVASVKDRAVDRAWVPVAQVETDPVVGRAWVPVAEAEMYRVQAVAPVVDQ